MFNLVLFFAYLASPFLAFGVMGACLKNVFVLLFDIARPKERASRSRTRTFAIIAGNLALVAISAM